MNDASLAQDGSRSSTSVAGQGQTLDQIPEADYKNSDFDRQFMHLVHIFLWSPECAPRTALRAVLPVGALGTTGRRRQLDCVPQDNWSCHKASATQWHSSIIVTRLVAQDKCVT